MRMMMKVKMDTEAASGLIADGSMPELMQAHLERLQPEAAFFGPENGVRTGFFVFDLKDPSDLPWLSEPLFSRFGATIEMFPVMNQEDLQKGLQKLGEEAGNQRPTATVLT